MQEEFYTYGSRFPHCHATACPAVSLPVETGSAMSLGEIILWSIIPLVWLINRWLNGSPDTDEGIAYLRTPYEPNRDPSWDED